MRDLKKLTNALKDAELEVRALKEGGWLYFNGVRYVTHPLECECGSMVVPRGRHCFCCGHLDTGGKCGCPREPEARICSDCGECQTHCECSTDEG